MLHKLFFVFRLCQSWAVKSNIVLNDKTTLTELTGNTLWLWVCVSDKISIRSHKLHCGVNPHSTLVSCCVLSIANTGKEFQTECSLTSSSPSVCSVRRWLSSSSSLRAHVFLIVSQLLLFINLLHPLVLHWARSTSMCVFKCILSEGATPHNVSCVPLKSFKFVLWVSEKMWVLHLLFYQRIII